MLIPDYKSTPYVENAMWPSPHAHRKPQGGRAAKLGFAFNSLSNEYGNRAIIPNASSLLLPRQNTCPDTSPKLLKALIILDTPEVCACSSCKMPWSKNTEARTGKRTIPGHEVSSDFLPALGLTCDEARLLHWAVSISLNTVNSFCGN